MASTPARPLPALLAPPLVHEHAVCAPTLQRAPLIPHLPFKCWSISLPPDSKTAPRSSACSLPFLSPPASHHMGISSALCHTRPSGHLFILLDLPGHLTHLAIPSFLKASSLAFQVPHALQLPTTSLLLLSLLLDPHLASGHQRLWAQHVIAPIPVAFRTLCEDSSFYSTGSDLSPKLQTFPAVSTSPLGCPNVQQT